MRFMLFVCYGGPTPPADAVSSAPDGVPTDDIVELDIDDWVDQMDGRGARILGEQLVGPEQAKTVRVRNGRLMLTDGPFAETKEVIAGFDIIEAADLAEAITIAAAHPMAHSGMLEVRAFHSE